MREPKFRKKLLIDRALEPVANTPDEFSEFLKQDRIVSAHNVKEAGLVPQ
jgi:hypothetical protein